MFLSKTTLFYLMVELYLHLLPKVQLRVSAFDNSQLQVVHESLESSYTRFNMGCASGDAGDEEGTRSRTYHGVWGGGVNGVTVIMYISVNNN